MAYTPSNWQDRISQNPGQFSVTGSVPGNITLTLNDNPSQAGTQVTAARMNNIEDELVFLDGLNYKGYIPDTGTVNSYAAALNPAITSYAAGQSLIFKAANTNTGPSTLNVNGLGVKTIVKYVGGYLTNISAGDIASGQLIFVVYDGSYFQYINAQHYMTSITITTTSTFTVPSGVYWLYVQAIGGGGGGAGASGGSYFLGTAGGGGGGYAAGWLSVTPGQQISAVIGAGGTAGTGSSGGSGTAGGTGGMTSFSSLTAYGGGGSGPGAGSNSAAGAGGPAVNSPLVVSGQTGLQSNNNSGGLGGKAANGAFTYGQGGQGGSGQPNNIGTNGNPGSAGAVLLIW